LTKYKVHKCEIPKKIIVNLGMHKRALFARMLTAYGISVDVAGDTFEHIIREGIKMVYENRFKEE